MTNPDILITSIVGGTLILFGLMVYWFAFKGPDRAKAKLLLRSPELDWSLPQFYGISRDWITYRVLPQSGLKTAWLLQTSHGQKIGEIKISTYINTPGSGHPVVINGKAFRFRKNVENFIQNGFIIETGAEKFYLVRDKGFGVVHTLKTNFRNLELTTGEQRITLRARGKRTLSLARNGQEVGVATFLNGFFPGFAAFSKEATELEQAILFYCMNLH